MQGSGKFQNCMLQLVPYKYLSQSPAFLCKDTRYANSILENNSSASWPSSNGMNITSLFSLSK